MEDILDNNQVVDNYNKFRKRAILTWLSIGFVRIILKFSKGFPSRPEEVLGEIIGSFIIGLLFGVIISPILAFIPIKHYTYKVRFIRVFWVVTCIISALFTLPIVSQFAF